MCIINRICAVIVVYKQSYDETKSFLSLLQVASSVKEVLFDVIIYDNSEKEQVLGDNTCFNRLSYYHDPRNLGVIPAYKYSIDYCEKNSIKWLLRLDQDSFFDERLINEFQKSIIASRNQCICYVPKIFSSGELISPSVIKHGGLWGKVPKQFVGIYPQKITFINSMSIIDTSNTLVKKSINNCQFMLDLSDHDFAYNLKNGDIYILDAFFEHSLSIMEKGYVSDVRYSGILESEILFSKLNYSFVDKIVFRSRLILRFFKHLFARRWKIALITLKGLFK